MKAIFALLIFATIAAAYDKYDPCERYQYFYLTSQQDSRLCLTSYGGQSYVDYCSQYTSGQHWLHINGTLRNLAGFCLKVSKTNLKEYYVPGYKCGYLSDDHLEQSSRWTLTCDDEFQMEGRASNYACMHIANAQNGRGSKIVMNECLGDAAPLYQQWNKIFAGYVGLPAVK